MNLYQDKEKIKEKIVTYATTMKKKRSRLRLTSDQRRDREGPRPMPKQRRKNRSLRFALGQKKKEFRSTNQRY